ncbi:MAG: TIGR01440 family protein [Liquorilactobacillus nagelii]|uniref:TIGR01440 family protein n=1 Tax=Liquorilactobacillus nagelii TaxID=82688 RepID=UPI00242BC0B3|nr:TIGR01440 family protein [Liquorilactobacillus nagelii]MCI1633239.1 TIGR01440 family protein [Liquorilactobacillus nagelii]MCI1699558.1 TIGR01440 family protein [Liquorilactobacillus nagelii]MCI1921124.1 TIGR01440 family protein [Liquorilactobacillus nagelii]MCI1975684.1 TIGR01440 family protein [Liquorilactobacillus nagelii]
MEINLKTLATQVKQGASELLQAAQLEAGDLFVLGCSTSEIQGDHIGKNSNLTIGRTIIKTLLPLLKERQLNLAVQGCEHLNRALIVEKEVAKVQGFEIVTVFPSLHAGGATQMAAFESFNHPVEVEHIVAQAGMDIGDTSIGMHVKFVQIPVRTSVKEIGAAHVTYLRSRPKLIGGQRAKYEWHTPQE